jgi:hypothetical protein
MDLTTYVRELGRQLDLAAAAGGEEAQALAERLSGSIDAAARLMLLEALSAAAAEITSELVPGSVELRLRAGEPEFVVTPPPAEESPAAEPAAGVGAWTATATDDSAQARINLRLPDRLKTRVEETAAAAGLSVNAWLVRAVAAAVDGDGRAPARRSATGGEAYTGWVA